MIVVENTTSSDPVDGPVRPVCLTDSSKRGGHISAVGNDIKSLLGPGVPCDLPEGGTSSAAPQVAGAAAMVWTLDGGLAPADVVGILRDTARPIDVDASLDSRCDPPRSPPQGSTNMPRSWRPTARGARPRGRPSWTWPTRAAPSARTGSLTSATSAHSSTSSR